MRPLPGSGILRIARRLCDPATLYSVVEPLLADWQHEWFKAPTRRRRVVLDLRWGGAALYTVAACAATRAAGAVLQRPGPAVAARLSRSAVEQSLLALALLAVAQWVVHASVGAMAQAPLMLPATLAIVPLVWSVTERTGPADFLRMTVLWLLLILVWINIGWPVLMQRIGNPGLLPEAFSDLAASRAAYSRMALGAALAGACITAMRARRQRQLAA